MAKPSHKANLRHRTVHVMGRDQNGFSMIELMIAVAIVAILTAIAIPTYQKQVMQSRESSAKSALLDLARREETYYSANNYYTTELDSLGYANINSNTIQVPNNTNEAYYTVTISPASSGTTASSYTATATPVAGSTQVKDPCGTYQIDYLGNQTNNGTSGTSSGGLSCW
jgi:type IV pilus assembly protein PilE